MERSANCLRKCDRMHKALHHQESDRVPISDFFWGSFIEKWRETFGLSKDISIYDYYDLDWIVTVPNMDPHIKPFQILEENDEHVIVQTGFEAIIEKKFALPMPAFLHFETDTPEKLDAFTFDDPWDDRRYHAQGDHQIGGVGDGFARNLPPWIDTIKCLHPKTPVFGSVCEAHEMLWRIIGSENVLTWIALYPEELARFTERLHTFTRDIAKAQIAAANGLLDGMVIWGDVAYRRDLLFSPETWRALFRPGVEAIVQVCHEAGLPVIYHGCGNPSRIFNDFIDIGVDAYNPLEAKAGLDVTVLRRQYGHQIAFCGNMDAALWAEASPSELERTVLTKLNAAKGGGFIFQSDHSVPSNIPPESYDFVVNCVRARGQYPLNLGAYDISDLH